MYHELVPRKAHGQQVVGNELVYGVVLGGHVGIRSQGVGGLAAFGYARDYFVEVLHYAVYDIWLGHAPFGVENTVGFHKYCISVIPVLGVFQGKVTVEVGAHFLVVFLVFLVAVQFERVVPTGAAQQLVEYPQVVGRFDECGHGGARQAQHLVHPVYVSVVNLDVGKYNACRVVYYCSQVSAVYRVEVHGDIPVVHVSTLEVGCLVCVQVFTVDDSVARYIVGYGVGNLGYVVVCGLVNRIQVMLHGVVGGSEHRIVAACGKKLRYCRFGTLA